MLQRRMLRKLLKSKLPYGPQGLSHCTNHNSIRLRQVDVKAEHFERQVLRLEQERDLWEKKYEVRIIGPYTTHAPLLITPISHRMHKRNIATLKRSLTNLSAVWKAYRSFHPCCAMGIVSVCIIFYGHSSLILLHFFTMTSLMG